MMGIKALSALLSGCASVLQAPSKQPPLPLICLGAKIVAAPKPRNIRLALRDESKSTNKKGGPARQRTEESSLKSRTLGRAFPGLDGAG